MDLTLQKILTPEEEELNKKRAELIELEDELARCELDLATLQAELHSFEQRYLRIVGSRYAELDEVRAQIAEACARLDPQNKAARKEAEQARKQAQESAESTANIAPAETRQRFKPSDELKKLYRDLAKQLHPDLTTDEQERARRHQLMIEVNRAYESGDEDRLNSILRDFQLSPESVKDEGIGAELIRIIRKIAQAKGRIMAINIEIEQLEKSDLAVLKTKVEVAEDQGRDLLSEMAKELDEEIAGLKVDGYDVLVKLIRKIDGDTVGQKR